MVGIDEREPPRYKCHKEVYALKIAKIVRDSKERTTEDGTAVGAMIHPSEDGYAPFSVTGQWLERYSPKVGGFFVVSIFERRSYYSPGEVFRAEHTRIQ